MTDQKENSKLDNHLAELKKGDRKFENVFKSISRMILEDSKMIEKVLVNGKPTFDFKIFRQGKKHIIGMYDEVTSFVSYVKDASEEGSSKEMAFVLVGEPGNGKTFFVDYLSSCYRNFLSKNPNKKYTFRFKNLKKLGSYGGIEFAESQTFEDPMILAMNLFETKEESISNLEKILKFDEKKFEEIIRGYRPLGACSSYILNDIRNHVGGDIEKIKEFIEIVPVTLNETLGNVTGKYTARDKITSSSVDLLGEESIQRCLHVKDTNNPFRFDLRIGALARVGGGGIHFSDEIFKNKKDLIQIYLGVIQNREIDLNGFKWPLDTLIIATSNNSEFNSFVAEREEAPIVDRCKICFVAHNTNYKLQKHLTEYALGNRTKTTFTKENLHIDPNLNYAASVAVVLSRLPLSEKMSPSEMMKLSAGEIAGEKSIKTLVEIIDNLNYEPDITKRFGQKGIGHRNLGRSIQLLMESSETNEGKCMYAGDVFGTLQQIILDYILESNDRAKYLNDIKIAKKMYKERIRTEMFDAYRDEPQAIEREVLDYVNMIIGIGADDLGRDKMWKYKDPQTGNLKPLKIDQKYIESVEERLNLKNKEQIESFRGTIRKIYGQKIASDPNYNFMDQPELVRAVTEVVLESDIHGAGSLIGALSNRTNEKNQHLYNRMIDTMLKKLEYCQTCAQKTIEYFCTKDDEK